MTGPLIEIRKRGLRWRYSCRVCLNQPGISGIESWSMALLYAEAHLNEWHPRIDWNALESA